MDAQPFVGDECPLINSTFLLHAGANPSNCRMPCTLTKRDESHNWTWAMPPVGKFNDDGLASEFLNPEREAVMKQRFLLIAAAASLVAGIASAQYPIIDKLAEKVIQKYQTSTCQQLWQKRRKPQSPEEQKVLDFLKSDPQRRQAFFNQIAGPVMNKMFECG